MTPHRTTPAHPARRAGVALAAAAFLLSVAGCGGSDDDSASGPTTTADGASATTTTTPATTSSAVGTTTVPTETAVRSVYFLRGEKVGPTGREVGRGTPAKGALEALLEGPTPAELELGFSTTIPEGTKLLGVTITDGIATVDLSGSYDDGGGTLSMMGRLAEVVFTLTQFPTVDAVSFRMEGEPVTALGGEGILVEEPIDRTYFADLTPAVLVESPLPFEQVSSPLTITGVNNTFESNVVYRLTGPDGTVLAEGHTTGTGGMGTWGPFAVSPELDSGGAGAATLRVFEVSARDGSEINVVEIPVEL